MSRLPVPGAAGSLRSHAVVGMAATSATKRRAQRAAAAKALDRERARNGGARQDDTVPRDTPSPDPTRSGASDTWIGRHRYPLWGITAMLMAFYIWTLVLAERIYGTWQAGGDAWNVWGAPQFVSRGWYGAMYRAAPTIPIFPLWLLVLTPVRAVCDALGLTGGSLFHGVNWAPHHPTAWLVYGPVCVLAAGAVLFAGDALAGALGVKAKNRMMLTACLALLAFYIAVFFAHPEYLLATALLLYALLAIHDGRPGRAGWLAGAAIATTPLVVLALPVLIARLSRDTWRRFGTRMLALPMLLLAPPFLTDPRTTWDAVGSQPTYIRPTMTGPTFGLDHPTPLVTFAHQVGRNPDGMRVVIAGPVRLVVVALVAMGIFALARRRPTLEWAIFVCGIALLARQLSEPVMNPYYLVPGFAVLAIVLACRSMPRALAGIVAAIAAIGAASLRMPPWPYFVLVASASALCVWSAWPSSPLPSSTSRQAAEPDAEPFQATRTALVGACALLLIAATTLYSRDTTSAQRAVLAANWRATPQRSGIELFGTPSVDSVLDRVYDVKGSRVTMIPTLAPYTWSVEPSLARRVKGWADAATEVERKWQNLAWVAPSRLQANPASHVRAAAWIPTLGAQGAPGKTMWKAGPSFCPSDHDFIPALLGAPDYRIELWLGCRDSAEWADTSTNLHLQADPVQFWIGGFADHTLVVTDPTGTKLLKVYVGWGVRAALHGASPGAQPYTRTVNIKGVMELRPEPSGLRIWDPWWSWKVSIK